MTTFDKHPITLAQNYRDLTLAANYWYRLAWEGFDLASDEFHLKRWFPERYKFLQRGKYCDQLAFKAIAQLNDEQAEVARRWYHEAWEKGWETLPDCPWFSN